MKTLNKFMAAALLASTIAGMSAVSSAGITPTLTSASFTLPTENELIGRISKSFGGVDIGVPKVVLLGGDKRVSGTVTPRVDFSAANEGQFVNTNYGDSYGFMMVARPGNYDAVNAKFIAVNAAGNSIPLTIQWISGGRVTELTNDSMHTMNGATADLANATPNATLKYIALWADIAKVPAGTYSFDADTYAFAEDLLSPT